MLTFSNFGFAYSTSLHSDKLIQLRLRLVPATYPPKLKLGNRPGEVVPPNRSYFAVSHAKHVSALVGFFVVQLLQYHSPSWSNPDAKGVSSMRPKGVSSMGRLSMGRRSAPFLRFKLTPELMTLVGGKALLLENGLLVG